MHIVAPVKNIDQVKKYLSVGADEFYGSPIYDEWAKNFGTLIEYNRRGNFGDRANFININDFSQAILFLNSHGKNISLTVNALRISPSQRKILRTLLCEFKKMGGTRVIASDLKAIEIAAEEGLSVTASSCVNVYNSYCAEFYRSIGVSRIILPRGITIEEIKDIIHNVPGVEYEVIVLNSACRFIDGSCMGLHGTDYGSFCAWLDHADYNINNRSSFSSFDIEQNHFYYKKMAKSACGLCAIYDLYKAGVCAIKIVGRTIPLELISGQITMLRKAISIAKNSSGRNEYLNSITDLKSSSDCRNGLNCYYPEMYRKLN